MDTLDQYLQDNYYGAGIYVDPLDRQNVLDQTSDHRVVDHPFRRGEIEHANCVRGRCYCDPFDQPDVDANSRSYTLKALEIRNLLIDIVRMRGLLSVLGPVIALNLPLIIETFKWFACAIPGVNERREFWALPNAIGALMHMRGIGIGGTNNPLSLGLSRWGWWPLPGMGTNYPEVRRLFPNMSVTSSVVQAVFDNLVCHTTMGTRSYFINIALTTLLALWYGMKEYRFISSPTEHRQRIPIQLTFALLRTLSDTWRTATETLAIVNTFAKNRQTGFRVCYRFIIRMNDITFRESCGTLAFFRGNINDIRDARALHPLLRLFCMADLNSLTLNREIDENNAKFMRFFVTYKDIVTQETVRLRPEEIPEVTVRVGTSCVRLDQLTGRGSTWDRRVKVLRERNIENVTRFILSCYQQRDDDGFVLLYRLSLLPGHRAEEESVI